MPPWPRKEEAPVTPWLRKVLVPRALTPSYEGPALQDHQAWHWHRGGGQGVAPVDGDRPPPHMLMLFPRHLGIHGPLKIYHNQIWIKFQIQREDLTLLLP